MEILDLKIMIKLYIEAICSNKPFKLASILKNYSFGKFGMLGDVDR